jgi:cation transport regulator
MPYGSTKQLPSAVKGLPGHGQRQFRAAFNSAYRQHSGDEKTAFKIAWGAVKTKYKKSGDRWVAKQDIDGGDNMKRLLADLSGVYNNYLNQAPMGDLANAKDAIDLIEKLDQDAKPDIGILRSLEETCVPAIGFDLAQDYNYNRYKETSLNTSETHHNSYPGSLQHQIRCVCLAAHADEEVSEYIGDNGFILAVYPNYIVTCAADDYDAQEADYWQVAYTFDKNNFQVTFGDAEPVDVGVVVVPHGTMSKETLEREAAENGEGDGEQDVNQDGGLMKTDGGQKFSKSAYLIIGDPKLPSTWKVRTEETPGKVTVPQLGRAYAALTKGFRGNKVQTGAEDKTKALASLKSKYKSMGADWPGVTTKQDDETEETPAWVLQGDDPPGGDEILVQSVSCVLQNAGYDEDTGILHVKGIATTGDAVNAKNQCYPTQVWQDNMPRLNRLVQQNKLVGESQHPADGKPSLDRTVLKYTKLELEGNELKFEADVLPTEPHGKNLQVLIQNGVSVDISSRGAGSMKAGDWNGTPGVQIVQRGFRCDAFDAVISGASPGSTITDWQMQSADTTPEEETVETKEMLEKLAASVAALAAGQEKNDKILAVLSQAKDEGVTKVEGVKPEDKKPEGAETVTQSNLTPSQTDIDRMNQMTGLMEQALVHGRIESMVQECKEKKGWGPAWVNSYRKHLVNAACKTLAELEQTSERSLKLLDDMVQDAPKFPGQGFNVQKDVGQRGFQSPREAIEALVSDLPDDLPGMDSGMKHLMQQDENGEPLCPNWISTPRRQMRKVLTNMSKFRSAGFDGPAAIQSLVRLSQGYDPTYVSEQFLDQACADGTTSVGAGGAPSSAIFIFPLVRRVYPQLIATEIASVQPMDRPDGKIFFLDAYRVTTGVDSVDEAGATVSNRMRIDRSDSFSDSYANSPGECNTANLIQLRLSNKSVTADNKKLYAAWTIEELQDLRAYHGLDASLELVGALSREIALEWNEVVLNEMLVGATAGNENYGTTAPAGYTQKEWDEYISRYIDKASNDIFKQRNGDMTHMIAGPDAWLKLAATFRTGTDPRSGPEPQQFAGLTLTPFMGGTVPGVKTYKTSFWAGRNTNKILVLRRGMDWSDTPYVWAPYLDYVSPVLTLPDTFNQKQGIMSRVAHQVVVGAAMATVTISAGTGVTV